MHGLRFLGQGSALGLHVITEDMRLDECAPEEAYPSSPALSFQSARSKNTHHGLLEGLGGSLEMRILFSKLPFLLVEDFAIYKPFHLEA